MKPKVCGMKQKAIWWFTPSLLEARDGPWGRADDFGHDAVAAWHAIIDWAADQSVDRIITGVAPYMTDRVLNQWPFHYICVFPQDPLARCFDDQTVQRHILTVRQIAAYGHKQGVAIMLHHYNCIAPERWVDSHPDLAKKLNDVDDPAFGKRFHVDRLGFLVGNLCWSDPIYKEFMGRCWDELFANVPELAGLMISPGEFNYCSCHQCSGDTCGDIFEQQQTEEVDTVNPDRLEMSLDLIQTFQNTMTRHDKEAIVRAWMMENWADRLPKEVTYATKFSVHDACWGQPDPNVHRLLNAGHKMWIVKAIEAENSGPIIWHDEKWCHDKATQLNGLNSMGTMAHLNGSWGHDGLSTFTASRNIQRLLEALEPTSATDNKSESDFCDFFGKQLGPCVYQATQLIASVPLHMSNVVHSKYEGFTYGFFYWFDGPVKWPGTLGTANMDPPDWANPDGITVLTALMTQSEADPDKLEQLLDNPTHSVISRLDEMIDWASQAIELLESSTQPANKLAASELNALITSGHIAKGLAVEYANLLRARLAWHVLENLPRTNTQASRVHKLVTHHYEQAIEALRDQLGWAMTLTNKHVDFVYHVGETREFYFQFPIATRLQHRLKELQRLNNADRNHHREGQHVLSNDSVSTGDS